MSKTGYIKYFEVFYQDLDDTEDTPRKLKRFVNKWRKLFMKQDLNETIIEHINFMGYVKFSSLLFTYRKGHYRLLPIHLNLKDEQCFDAFLHVISKDLVRYGANSIISTGMID